MKILKIKGRVIVISHTLDVALTGNRESNIKIEVVRQTVKQTRFEGIIIKINK